MSKHTPGPWLIHEALPGHKGDIFSPTAKKVTDCHHIARCFAPKPSEPLLSDLHMIVAKRDAVAIIEANARLIAASPDMLEALLYVETRCVSEAAYQHASIEDRKMRDMVVAAIAKAEGK